jgi:hypothetical protein
MSDELFEVAFSGQINNDADLNEVKAKFAKMFNADENKLAHLFSGKRIIIKKNIDAETAAKYQTAIARVGAKCELKSLSASNEISPGPDLKPELTSPSPSSPPATAPMQTTYTAAADYGDVPPPPELEPLGITADQIDDLAATVAPVGSEVQDEIKEIAEPVIDISDLDIAPVGSVIDSSKKEPDPPPPDTSGITLVD